jgi:ribose 5-phosphate isomerase B
MPGDERKTRVKILIGSDHAAYQQKQIIMQMLEELGHEYEDMGAFTNEEPANDYHLIGAEVSQYVVDGKADRGILMCGTGIGMSVAANKVPGADAALCYSLFGAKMSREHNNAKVLVLGARMVGDDLAKEIVKVWLTAGYTGGRHEIRNANLRKIEAKYQRE